MFHFTRLYPSQHLRASVATTAALLALATASSMASAAGPVATARAAGLGHATPVWAAAPAARLPAALPLGESVTLHSQMGLMDGDGITSQDFEPYYFNRDSQAADDFAVPAGYEWTLSSITASGYFTMPGTAVINGARVEVYSSNPTKGGVKKVLHTLDLPATAVSVDPGGETLVDLVTVALPPGIALTGGTLTGGDWDYADTSYWISVQLKMDLDSSGQWFWATRLVPGDGEGVWRNPGGGFTTYNCLVYKPIRRCMKQLGGKHNTDLGFELTGTSAYVGPVPQ